jgi:hypothetical protein
MYRGDICGRPDCNSFDPDFNVGINYKIWPHVVIGTEVTYFHLAAHSHGAEVLKSFTSSDLDFKLYGRYTLFETKIRRAQDRNRTPRRISPFVLIGISALYYHTTSQTSQKSSSLHQNASSTGVTMGWPLGAGLSFYISKRVSLLSECLYVNTFSDHLDNVIGENRVGWHDSYLMVLLKLQVNFASSKSR